MVLPLWLTTPASTQRSTDSVQTLFCTTMCGMLNMRVMTFGPRFPSMAPTNPAERAALHALFLPECALVYDVTVDGE